MKGNFQNNIQCILRQLITEGLVFRSRLIRLPFSDRIRRTVPNVVESGEVILD
jgi:hypothetical protein